jgi:hypothetical protein
MKLDRIFQSLLFGLLIVGFFAAMARNGYGFTFLGLGCFGLAGLYFIQIIWKLLVNYSNPSKPMVIGLFELFFLAVILILFGFRALYIYVPNGEWILTGAVILLVIVYCAIAVQLFSSTKKENSSLAWNLLFFYASNILFMLAMATYIIQSVSVLFGTLAVVVAVPFVYSIVKQKKYTLEGKAVSLLHYVTNYSSKAGIVFLFFIFSALYTGLALLNVIPHIENTEQPKAYIELVDNAESRKEKPVDGQYQHEKYKEAMNLFLDHYGAK